MGDKKENASQGLSMSAVQCNKVTTNLSQTINTKLSVSKKKITPECEMHCGSCLHLEVITAVHFQTGGAVDLHACPSHAWLIAPDILNTDPKDCLLLCPHLIMEAAGVD